MNQSQKRKIKMDEISVLLVDDEADFLRPMLKRLKIRNLNVSSVESGEEALNVISENEIDVVVLDVRMPGMNGLETLAEIKRIKPATEVIMLTGHANIDVALEGMGKGAFDYLMKPMEIDELVYKIQDAYQQKYINQKPL